jgi:hypothetical protein
VVWWFIGDKCLFQPAKNVRLYIFDTHKKILLAANSSNWPQCQFSMCAAAFCVQMQTAKGGRCRIQCWGMNHYCYPIISSTSFFSGARALAEKSNAFPSGGIPKLLPSEFICQRKICMEFIFVFMA